MSWCSFFALGEGQWQWELRRASLYKWCWSEMCVASAGQGHADSDLCVGRSPPSTSQIRRLLLAGSPGVKNVHHNLCRDWGFTAEQSCACPCKTGCAYRAVKVSFRNLSWKKTAAPIQQSLLELVYSFWLFIPYLLYHDHWLFRHLYILKTVCTAFTPFHRSLAFSKTGCYCTFPF